MLELYDYWYGRRSVAVALNKHNSVYNMKYVKLYGICK